ncbi:unnamed protein product, partial [Polarella glacialis]
MERDPFDTCCMLDFPANISEHLLGHLLEVYSCIWQRQRTSHGRCVLRPRGSVINLSLSFWELGVLEGSPSLRCCGCCCCLFVVVVVVCLFVCCCCCGCGSTDRMANIWTAAGDGDIQRVEELISSGPMTPTTADDNGYTPIHAAASWGHHALLEALLAREAAANVRDGDGDTPLHHLVHSELSLAEMRPVMELLLRHGADPRLRNNEGQTCLDAARDAARAEEAIENGEDEEGGLDVNETEFAKLLRTDWDVLLRKAGAAGSGAPGDHAEVLSPTLPPEGVEWANRWAELENAFVALEAERDLLKTEVGQLRRQKVDQTVSDLSNSAKAALIDSKELKELRAELDEARRQADARLGEVVVERDRSAKLSEELQKRTAALSTMSTDKLSLQYEKNRSDAELLPIKEARDRLQLEKDEAERLTEELRAELVAVTEERTKFYNEKLDNRRELSQALEAAKADAAFYQKEAREARELQNVERQQAAEIDRKLKEKIEEFAGERASLEEKLHNRKEQLDRMSSLKDSAQEQLAEAHKSKEAAEKAKAKAGDDAKDLKVRVSDLEDKLTTVENEHEDLLRQRLPGASSGLLPEGFGSLAELVREATSAREEALRERQSREHLQEVLQEVEREVRARYPALMGQREEAERLRRLSAQLTQQNEGLLVQTQELETKNHTAEARVRKAERSEHILEAHARDIAKQLAILVHENRRLSGSSPTVASGLSDLEALEADRRAFRTVQDLVEQNEALKKSVARLSGECETEAQRELQESREEFAQQEEAVKKHLSDKAEQIKALADTVKRVTQERDELQRAMKKLQASESEMQPAASAGAAPNAASGVSSGKSGSASGGTSVAGRDIALLRDQLTAVREEFAKCSERLYAEVKELRTSELKARQELATTKGQLDFEMRRKGDLEVSLQQAEKKLQELKTQLKRHEDRVVALEDSRRKEESAGRDLEAALGQAKRDKSHVDMQLKVERSKVSDLERSNTTLLAEKTSHGQLIVDLQARMSQESEAYREMKKDLEAGYKREEVLLREQLELSQKRQEDFSRTIEELSAARAAREAEAIEAKARVQQLEVSAAKLEEKLTQSSQEIHELREAGAARPRRGSDVAAEAKSQLERSQASWERGGEGTASSPADLARLEKQLRHFEEREKEHDKSSEIWQTLLAQHEADLKTAREEAARLQSELDEFKGLQATKAQESEKARGQQSELEAKLVALGAESRDLRGQLDSKEAEVVAARLEGEQKAREAGEKLEATQRANAGARDEEIQWERQYRDVLGLHARDAKELDILRERLTEVERHSAEINRQRLDLEGEAERARAERSDQLQSLQKRLEQAEQHAKALGDENHRYQEHLLTLSDSRLHGESGLTGDAAAAAEATQQRIAAELRKAREINELQRRSLEMDKEHWQREAKALRVEAQELRERLDREQREVLRLQAETRLEQRAVAKLGQLELLEDEKRRLEAEVKSFESRLDDISKETEDKRSQAEPLEKTLSGLKEQLEESER